MASIPRASTMSPMLATKFIILLGFVSLFADVSYEGARSITGPYLALLGAGAAAVGFISGAGELLGYALRYVSGVRSDKTRHYWNLILAGYAVTLAAVPLMAVAERWEVVFVLILVERLGKAIRTSPRDVMLSYASEHVGEGFGFGLHKALDQIGAFAGPLMVTWIFYATASYKTCFAVMIIPAVMVAVLLAVARSTFPITQIFENKKVDSAVEHPASVYGLYVVGLCCIGAGYIDFPLIAYHFYKGESVPVVWVPVFYGVAMGVSGISALLLGRVYDRYGMKVVMWVAGCTAFVAPLVFFGGFYLALAGMMLWGIGLGAQDSIMKAYIAMIAPFNKRGTAYGLVNMCFGLSWFFGSVVLGFLYEISWVALALFSVISQLASLLFFIRIHRLWS